MKKIPKVNDILMSKYKSTGREKGIKIISFKIPNTTAAYTNMKYH